MEVLSAKRALSIPETLAAIFFWIYTECLRSDALAHLARYGQVNKTWFDEAMRLLWRDPTTTLHPKQSSLVLLFAKTNPERRQFYANFIQRANLTTIGGYVTAQSNYMLRDIEFPRLRCLRLIVDYHGFRVDVPFLRNHSLTELEIESYCSKSKDDMDMILEQIPDIFPQLEKVTFVQRAWIKSISLGLFKSRLTRLKVLELYEEYRANQGKT